MARRVYDIYSISINAQGKAVEEKVATIDGETIIAKSPRRENMEATLRRNGWPRVSPLDIYTGWATTAVVRVVPDQPGTAGS